MENKNYVFRVSTSVEMDFVFNMLFCKYKTVVRWKRQKRSVVTWQGLTVQHYFTGPACSFLYERNCCCSSSKVCEKTNLLRSPAAPSTVQHLSAFYSFTRLSIFTLFLVRRMSPTLQKQPQPNENGHNLSVFFFFFLMTRRQFLCHHLFLSPSFFFVSHLTATVFTPLSPPPVLSINSALLFLPVVALCKLLAGNRQSLGCESPIDFGKRRVSRTPPLVPLLSHRALAAPPTHVLCSLIMILVDFTWRGQPCSSPPFEIAVGCFVLLMLMLWSTVENIVLVSCPYTHTHTHALTQSILKL